MSFLQRKKLAQLAGQEYNLHIRTRIKPKFGSSSPNLFVRIQLKINQEGEIVYHEIIESSGSKAFDKVAKWDREFAEKIQRKYKLSNYQMLCLAFAKGFVLGAIIL